MRVNNVSFGSERPIYCVKVEKEDGTYEEKLMTESEANNYHKQQEEIKEQKRKEETLKKQQEWLALINKPQTFQKVDNEGNKNDVQQ